jgi:VanZ family protein
MSMRPWFLAWLPVLGWAGLIFWFSSQPDLRIAPDATVDFVVRKLGHMVVFGILALLAWRALATTTRLRRPWAWAFLLTVAYAATDEIHQGFTEGRYPSVLDVGIDALGALVAIAVARLLLERDR